MPDFEPNPHVLGAAGQQAVSKINEQLQPVVDEIHQRYAGRPVDDVRAALMSAWQADAGLDFPEPLLTNVASKISEGKRVVLRAAG
jgi:hypothetical protein